MFTSVNKKIQNEDGYVLVDLALTVVVIGILIAVGIPMYKSYSQRDAVIQTEKRMDIIAHAFSNYIQMRWRLPCPADPNETAQAFGTERTGGCTGAISDRYGIIPYRTIGIPEQYARDGYGNFMTYVVSPDFTSVKVIQDDGGGGGTNTVHRRLAHLVGDDNYALVPISQFCAPTVATGDIQVTQDGQTLFEGVAPRAANNVIRIPSDGDPSTNLVPAANLNRDPTNRPVTGVALALISHGENGQGAFQISGAQGAGTGIAGGGSETTTSNINNTEIRMESEFSQAGAQPYDDIIRFYTQDEIYGAAGGGSCEHL